MSGGEEWKCEMQIPVNLHPGGIIANDSNDSEALATQSVEFNDRVAARTITPEEPNLDKEFRD